MLVSHIHLLQAVNAIGLNLPSLKGFTNSQKSNIKHSWSSTKISKEHLGTSNKTAALVKYKQLEIYPLNNSLKNALALTSASDSPQHAIQISPGFIQSNPTLHYTPTSDSNSPTPNTCWTHCTGQVLQAEALNSQPRWTPAHCAEISWPSALPRRCPMDPRLSPQLVLKRRQLHQPHRFPLGVEWEPTCCWAANGEVTSVADCTRTVLPSSISLKQAHTADSYHLHCLLLPLPPSGREVERLYHAASEWPFAPLGSGHDWTCEGCSGGSIALLGWGSPCNTRTTGWAPTALHNPEHFQLLQGHLKASLRSCGARTTTAKRWGTLV